MIKTLLCVSISSLVLLLPIHGQIREGGAIAHYYPKIQKTLPDTPLKPQEAAQPAVVPQAVVYTPPTPKPAVGVVNCGDNIYKQYIYSHESGCNTASINSIGCAGIGQACPGSKLPCSLLDFTCQDAFFTSYANSRYGGWAGAYSWWLQHSWW